MANERPAAKPAEKPAEKSSAKPRNRSRHRSGRSPHAQTPAPAPKNRLRWTWREYVLQLSVVILGVVVTFIGSGLVERWRQARDVRVTMTLIHSELEKNRAAMLETLDWLGRETHAYRTVTENRFDLHRIPRDTIDSYFNLQGRILFFHPRNDAFEVLKNSGLMTSVNDKNFLLAVSQGYAALREMEENIDIYYEMKKQALDEMSKGFSDADREKYYFGDQYALWEAALTSRSFSDFVISAPNSFQPEYIDRLVGDVDRSIRAIEEKYDTQKYRFE